MSQIAERLVHLVNTFNGEREEHTNVVASRLHQFMSEFEMLLKLLNVERVVEKERTGNTNDPFIEHVRLKKKGE